MSGRTPRGAADGETSARRTRGRPPRLDHARILAAARGIEADELSMPALAESLGVSTQALYYYYPNRERLLEAIAEQVLGEIPPVPDRGQGWRDWLRECALETRRALLAAPGVAERLRAGGASVSGLRIIDDGLGMLTAHGFSDDEALRVYELITNFVIRACATDARRGRRRRAFSPEVEAAVRAQPEGTLPHLSRMIAKGLRAEPDETFERNLDDLLHGVEAGRRRR